MITKKIGIILLLSIFIMSSFNKIFSFQNTLNGIENKGLPFPFFALLGAITFQLLGIIGILTNEFKLIKNKNLKYSKYLLVVFTLLATYFYHNIFTQENQTINFMKNISIIGGLLII